MLGLAVTAKIRSTDVPFVFQSSTLYGNSSLGF
jgi:hypothetical protein